jgi:ABC-type transporter Mla MlaB component
MDLCDEAKKAMAALAADPAPERQRKLTELFKLSAV